MRVTTEDWNNGWHGIEMGISINEIDYFIKMLKMLKDDPDQHFHINSDYKAKDGIGSITFYVKNEKEHDNMEMGSKALLPGEEIPDPKLKK